MKTIKRLFLAGLVVLTLVTASWVLALEPTSTPAASKTDTPSAQVDDKIQNLKDKLATKVAELRESQTRGFYGAIEVLTKTNFTLVTGSGEIKVRYEPEVAIFKIDGQNKKTAGKITDLKNTVSASVLGVFDPETKQHTAKTIILQTLPKFYSGVITSVDKTKATLQIKSGDADLTVDYEKTTVANEYDQAEAKFKKSGLSRMAVGDQMLIWGTQNKDDPKNISAARLVKLPKALFESEPKVAGTTTEATPASSLKPSPSAAAASAKPKPTITPAASPTEST